MSILSRLFGKGAGTAEPEAEPEMHNGYAIFPEPMRDGETWRIAARIVKNVDGQERTHRLIRADTLATRDAAVSASLGKARKVIDEQGDRLFD